MNILTSTPLKVLLLALVLVLPFSQSFANDTLQIKKITKNVYAIVGELGNRNKNNLANNATFGVVVTKKGVVLIDSGGTWQGAQAIDKLIKQITQQPVVKVINTGGQDHRWLGNGYFKKQGAQIIASKVATDDQKTRFQDQLIMLRGLLGEKVINNTKAVYADKTFTDNFEFTLGKTKFEITHIGAAHTPGDSFVWLPQKKVMFTGDVVYTERMLGVGSQSNSKSWINVYQKMALHKSKHLIPGHGNPTDIATANKDTYEYLVYLRNSMAKFIDSGGDISEISKVDQSKYNYLLNYKNLSGRNALQVFSEMEWE